MRKDFQIICNWIKENSNIIDLGCGDGELIRYIQSKKKITATGVEKDHNKVKKCININMSIFHQDIIEVFSYYKQKFDFVILSQTIQVISNPDFFIEKCLQIGKKSIISFVNYGYFKNRLQFLLMGKKPINYAFQQNWYNNDDIHPVTILDFENYCKKKEIRILKKIFLKGNWRKETKFLPNLFAGNAIYLLEKK